MLTLLQLNYFLHFSPQPAKLQIFVYFKWDLKAGVQKKHQLS